MIENSRVVEALHALAHEARLEVFLALVEAGPEGRAAGSLAQRLGMTPSALSFHLARLRHAGLVASRREGQRIHYSACYEQMEGLVEFLTARCCSDSALACGPVCGGSHRPPAAPAAAKARRTESRDPSPKSNRSD